MEENNFDTVRAGRSRRANDVLAIPVRYRRLNVENFIGHDDEVGAALDAIARSAGVFLSGTCGVGKTHLAVALLSYWYADALCTASMESGTYFTRPSGQFASTTDIVIEIAETGKRGEAKLLRKYERFDCLVIDDLGAEVSSERQRQILGVIIDLRYRHRRRTIITSNLDVRSLAGLYDDRMVSRIVGMCEVIHLVGPDRRLTSSPEQQTFFASV